MLSLSRNKPSTSALLGQFVLQRSLLARFFCFLIAFHYQSVTDSSLPSHYVLGINHNPFIIDSLPFDTIVATDSFLGWKLDWSFRAPPIYRSHEYRINADPSHHFHILHAISTPPLEVFTPTHVSTALYPLVHSSLRGGGRSCYRYGSLPFGSIHPVPRAFF